MYISPSQRETGFQAKSGFTDQRKKHKKNVLIHYTDSAISMEAFYIQEPINCILVLSRSIYVTESSSMSRKLAGTCYWFQISFILQT